MKINKIKYQVSSIMPFIIIFAIIVSAGCNKRKQISAEQSVFQSDTTEYKYYGNYYKLQPGLTGILDQIPKNVGRLLTGYIGLSLKREAVKNIYPFLFNIKLSDKAIDNLGDTLKYNWQCDTIICHNKYCSDDYYLTSELISSCDTIRLYSSIPEDEYPTIISHNFYVEPKFNNLYKQPFIDILKQWNPVDINYVFRIDKFESYARHSIFRLIVKKGVLIDLKYQAGISDIIYDRLLEI